MQAYIFQSADIAKALVSALKRGVKVEVIWDRRQRKETYGIADFLANSGIPSRIDSAHPYAHNKVMVIDEETFITGSFNFTKSAEDKNAENLLVIKGKDIAIGAKGPGNLSITNSHFYAATAYCWYEPQNTDFQGGETLSKTAFPLYFVHAF